MLNSAQMNQTLGKMLRYEQTLEPHVFRKIGEMEADLFETAEQHHAIPGADAGYRKAKPGDIWGGEGRYAWFTGSVNVPAAYAGQRIYLRPDVGGYEAMLWVDGTPYGTYATKIVQTGHGKPLLRPDFTCGDTRKTHPDRRGILCRTLHSWHTAL